MSLISQPRTKACGLDLGDDAGSDSVGQSAPLKYMSGKAPPLGVILICIYGDLLVAAGSYVVVVVLDLKSGRTTR